MSAARASAGLAAALAAAVATMTGGATPAVGQLFSPGRLAKPHAALEGMDHCGACHDEKNHLAATLCLTCHSELAPEIQRGTGLHGRLAPDARNRCASCHPDHRGRDFAMVSWAPGDRRKFDHRRAGWPLRGKHASTTCESCHDRRRLADPAVARWLTGHPARTTFLGLEARCASCHFDEHRGQLGSTCESCHTDDAWTFMAAPGFDHARADFALRGKHKAVPCADCHPQAQDEGRPPSAPAYLAPRAPAFMRMKPVAHAGCATCHRDPHQGAFGGACADCHTEDGWDVIKPSSRLGASFHDSTKFPLRGRHVDVGCKTCHGPFGSSHPAVYKGLPFKRCGDCHADAHAAQLASHGASSVLSPPDCAACHAVTGFAPARFELEQHDATTFKLTGAHRTTACRDCHPVDKTLPDRVPAAVKARLIRHRRPLVVSQVVLHPDKAAQTCSACHADPHQGQFAKAIAREDCRGCHTTESFTKLRFDHDRDSGFPLTGAHAKTACARCHPREPIIPDGAVATRYRPLPTTCAGCHADEHQGQLTRADEHQGQPARGKDCGFCHPTDSFKRTTFRHDDPRFTTFALAGKHSTLPCASCHRRVEVAPATTTAPALSTTRYRPLPRDCAGCHADFHRGAFRGFEP